MAVVIPLPGYVDSWKPCWVSIALRFLDSLPGWFFSLPQASVNVSVVCAACPPSAALKLLVMDKAGESQVELSLAWSRGICMFAPVGLCFCLILNQISFSSCTTAGFKQ